jgi:RimJ/RimL family protein N-acetyltransferase
MAVTLTPFRDEFDEPALVTFLSSNTFPFHTSPEPSAAEAQARIDHGSFRLPDKEVYWITDDGDRVGFVSFQEMSDEAPVLDLRLSQRARGRGVGTQALRQATTAVFTAHPAINRIEGVTRHDNIAMRTVFANCGYVLEAHYRQAWPGPSGIPTDATGYAIIRHDWQTGQITPIGWP